MSEPRVERIGAAMETGLAAIVGDSGSTYWYTPKVVVRVDQFDHFELTPAVDPVIEIRPGDVIPTEGTTGNASYDAEWFLLYATQWTPASDDPFLLKRVAGMRRQTLQHRLMGDVDKWIRRAGQPSHGAVPAGALHGLVDNIEVVRWTRDEWDISGWAVVVGVIKTKYTLGLDEL